MSVSQGIFRKFDAAQFSRNRVREDLPNRTIPVAAAQIAGQYSVLQWLVESRAIPKSAKTARTRTADAATKLQVSVHLLPDQIRRHSDWTTEVVYGTDWWRTKHNNNQSRLKSTSHKTKTKIKRKSCGIYHCNCLRINGLRDDIVLVVQIFDHFVEGRPFDLFPFQVAQWLRKIEKHTTLP